jgi:hydrogenase 3 maturation protease
VIVLAFDKIFSDKLKDAEKLVILAVGNTIRSDDGIGPKIIKELTGKLKDNIKLIDSGTVPESFTSIIKKANPTHLLIIDAAGMGKKPGEIQFIKKENIIGISFSTHQMPLSLLWGYLEGYINSKIYLLGIQPKTNEFGEELSPEVEKSKNKIVDIILRLFKK